MKKKFIFFAIMLLTLLVGVKWNTLNAQDNLGLNGKTFRLKVLDNSISGNYGIGQYITILDASDGGMVGVSALKDDDGQIFTLEYKTGSANQYYLHSANDYNINFSSSNTASVTASKSNKAAIGITKITRYNTTYYTLTTDDNGTKYFQVSKHVLKPTILLLYANVSSDYVMWALEEVVACTPPDTPENLKAGTVTHNSVELSWNAVADATKYNVYRDEEQVATNITAPTYTVTNLEPETNYNFAVTAVNGTCESAHSTPVNVTTNKAPKTQKVAFKLMDSNGDGWEGAILYVYLNGSNASTASYTLASGSEITYYLDIDEGADVELYFRDGDNVRECSYELYYYEDGVNIITSGTSGRVDGNNAYYFTVRGPIVNANVDEIAFGSVRLGDEWSEKTTPSYNVSLSAEYTTIQSVAIDNNFFTTDVDLSGAAGQKEFSFNVSYDKNAAAGEKSGKIVITYMNHEDVATKEINLSATAYTPVQGDMAGNPYQVAFSNNTTYTTSVTAANMHDDYIFPYEYNEGVTPDAIFRFTLNETSLVTVNLSTNNYWLAVYDAGFGGQEGPKADNQITTWLNETVMGAGTYYVLVASTEDYNITITREDIPEPQITYLSPMDGEVLFANNPVLSWGLEFTDSYRLSLGTSEDNLQVVVDWTTDLDNTYYQTENLQLGTKYYWKIEAKSAVGTNDTVQSFVTPLDGPTTITASVMELYPGDEVTLTWDVVNSANLLGYNVYADGVLVREKISATTLTLQYEEIERTSYFPRFEFAVAAVYELGESNRATTNVNVQAQIDLTINVRCDGAPVAGATVVLANGIDELGKNIAPQTFTTDANGQINTKVLSLLSTGDDVFYTVTVSKAMYETVEDVIAFHETYFNTELLTKDIVIEMQGVENIVANPSPIYYSQPTTITWDAVNANNVTYNVYVNGTKHNSAALTTTTYVINDLPYNVADGNSIEVKAVYGGVESASTPIYVKVVGTFTAQYNVKDDNGNPIEGATIVITNNFNDELNNVIPQFEITTDANGQATIALPLLPGREYYEYYQANISKGAYNSTSDMMVSYNYEIIYANGQVVERNAVMSLPSPRMAQIEAKNYFIGDDVEVTWETPDIDPLPASFLGYNIYQVPLEGENTKLNNTLLTNLTYTVENLPYGTHYIGISAVYQEGESSMTQTSVKITAYGKLIGTVVDTEGNYLSGAEIVVTGYDEFNVEQTYDNIQTDKNGQFVIEDMFLSGYDGYTVKATKFGYEDYTSSAATNAHVTYNDGAASEVTVVMKSYPAVELNVQSSDEVDYAYVSWDSPVGAQEYTLYRTDLSSNETTEVAAGLTSTNYEDESWEALANGEYQYGVSVYMEETLEITEDFADGIPEDWLVYRNNTSANYEQYNWKAATTVNGISMLDNNGSAASINTGGNNAASASRFYMATSLIDLTETVNPKINFYYYTPYYSSTSTSSTNTLRVLVLTESEGQGGAATYGDEIWSNNSKYTTGWTNSGDISLSEYQGQKVYIVFETNVQGGRASAVDYIQITADPKYYTSKISWAAPLVKGAIIYTGTGNWNDAANWSTGEVPSASDDVTIKGQVAVTGNVNVNSITIARNQSMMGMGDEDYSLTVETGSTLTITNGISNNSYSRGLVIKDGAQLFQNYADVDATFVMDIQNPTSWSDSPTEGWQIIASPLKESSTYSFVPADDDYDLYKYDGTKELQWVNHKYHTQGNFEFFYNFEDRTIPAGFTSIDADGVPATKWYAEMYNNSSYLKELPMPYSNLGSNGCVYSEVIANADNYLVLPKSKIVEGSKLQFRAASFYSKTYAEAYLTGASCEDVEILVSENGNTSTADFVSIEKIEVTNGSSNGVVTWKTFEIDLSAYADKEIYVALRHTSGATTYNNMLMIDDLRLVGDAFEMFEDSFVQGRGYLASYKSQTTATFYGKLNHEKTFRFKDVTSYNANNDTVSRLSNFYLLGNPFTFNMNWDNVALSGVYDGYATVNNDGTYDYHTSGTINVGDGFFVQTIANNPSVEYTSNRRRMEQRNVNLMVTAKNGSDNVIINFAGDANEGFKKLDNHNKSVAEIYVIGEDGRYGILNYNEDVETVDVEFDAKRLGNYTISALTEGEFETVILVDRATGIETNLLVDNYTFTAKANEENNRFIIKFADGQQSTDNGQFAYQSGGELIINAQGTVQIVDVLGRVVYQNEHSNDINRINVENFERASYVVRCVNGKEVKTQKIVIL